MNTQVTIIKPLYSGTYCYTGDIATVVGEGPADWNPQGCLRAARPGVLALGVLTPRTLVCAHEGTGSSHLPRARFVVHERLSAGCAPILFY